MKEICFAFRLNTLMTSAYVIKYSYNDIGEVQRMFPMVFPMVNRQMFNMMFSMLFHMCIIQFSIYDET